MGEQVVHLDFVDPFDEISVNIGKMLSSSGLKEIKEELNKKVVENKANRSFEIQAREMKGISSHIRLSESLNLAPLPSA